MWTGLVILLILITAAQASVASAASFIQQRYRFIALTSSYEQPGQFPYVMWIVEDRSGGGHSSTLLQVVVDSDGLPALLQTGLKSYGDWQWLYEGAGRFCTEQFRVLSETQGLFWIDEYDMWIQSPLPNERLSQAFRDFQGHAGAYGWNNAMEAGGFDPPRIDGIDWDLVYYYPGGLYIDYELADAYYFPQTRHLLLFTHQDMLATGMDTMHGFIILRLSLDDG